MLVVETVVRIRREHAAGKPIKAIARDLRLSRKVVRKAVRSPEGAFTYRRKVQPLPRIGPFKPRLDVLLAENEARSRWDRLRMTRIHDLLVREGFDGSYDSVRRYAARWRVARRAPTAPIACALRFHQSFLASAAGGHSARAPHATPLGPSDPSCPPTPQLSQDFHVAMWRIRTLGFNAVRLPFAFSDLRKPASRCLNLVLPVFACACLCFKCRRL